MDKLIEKLAVALQQEFGHFMRADSDDSWQKAARGMVENMGLKASTVNNNVYYFDE